MMRQNIIAGLLLFLITISLGPYMMRGLKNEEALVDAQTELMQSFAALRASENAISMRDAGGGEADDISEQSAPKLQDVSALALAATRATRAHVNYTFANFRRDNVTFTHAHGNLQGMLNILVGLFLGKLAVHAIARQLLSLGFIAGAYGMAGSAFLGNMLGQVWALQFMIYGGAILIASIAGLLLVVLFRGFERTA